MASEETSRHAEQVLDAVSLGDWSVLVDGIVDDLSGVYVDGLSEGLKLTGMGVDLDRINRRAVDWARENAASLVSAIKENTRAMLRATVAQGIEAGWGAAQMATEIAKSPAFDDDRARLIAKTEILAANNAGNMRGYRDAKAQGVNVMKEWMAGGENPCPVCEDNEAEGPIELDDEFPSGDDSSPAHPGCVCATAPYLPDEEGEGDEEEE